MPLTKKIVIPITLLLIISINLSGCILDDLLGNASFSLTSSSIIDNEGFPALKIFYSCKGMITLKLFDPSSKVLDTDLFFTGEASAILNLGSYRQTIKAGTYTLKAFNKNNDEIFSKTYSYKNSDITILSCSQKWWKNSGDYKLIGLELSIQNNRKVPIYPYDLTFFIDSETTEGLIIPNVILPGNIDTIYCTLYKDNIPSEDSFTISLNDIDGYNLATSTFTVDTTPNVNSRSFTKGVENTLYLPYPDFLYNYYHGLDRYLHEDYGIYVFDQYDDIYLDIFCDCLFSTLPFGQRNYNSKGDVEKIEFVASFVQGLKYKKDSLTNDSFEYPNYPIETLFTGSGGGDCEDKSILLASILDKLGFKTALFRLPSHMAIGVELGENSVSGYEYYTGSYYYLETTTEGKPLGFIPNDYKNPSDLTIHKISSRELLLHNWVDDSLTIYTDTDIGDVVKVELIAENLGRIKAENIELKGAFSTQYTNNHIKSETKTISLISPGSKEKIILIVDIPKSYTTVFKTYLLYNGKTVEFKESASTFP